MADATVAVAALNTLDPERRDAVLKAAHKLWVLSDALVTHSDCAQAGEFEDVETAIAIVSSVARRQSKLAALIVRALDGVSTDTTAGTLFEGF
jgi:hypothetical protein